MSVHRRPGGAGAADLCGFAGDSRLDSSRAPAHRDHDADEAEADGEGDPLDGDEELLERRDADTEEAHVDADRARARARARVGWGRVCGRGDGRRGETGELLAAGEGRLLGRERREGDGVDEARLVGRDEPSEGDEEEEGEEDDGETEAAEVELEGGAQDGAQRGEPRAEREILVPIGL